MTTEDCGRPALSEPDDASVIARVLEGETHAFASLVGRYQAALYRHAVCMVLDHDVAVDMVQDAFVRAYVNLGTCRDPARFRAWLFQTLRNRCLDHLKGAHRRMVPMDRAESFADPGERPDARVERARLRDEIRRALLTLPRPQREAFLMHYVEGMPYEAMAETLDASVSALKMRVLRAREALTAALQRAHVTDAAPVRLLVRRS